MPLNTKPECVRNIEKAYTEVGGGVVDLSALHLLIKELLKKSIWCNSTWGGLSASSTNNSGITVLEDLPFQIGGKKGTHIHAHMICEFAYLKLNKPCSSYAGI